MDEKRVEDDVNAQPNRGPQTPDHDHMPILIMEQTTVAQLAQNGREMWTYLRKAERPGREIFSLRLIHDTQLLYAGTKIDLSTEPN